MECIATIAAQPISKSRRRFIVVMNGTPICLKRIDSGFGCDFSVVRVRIGITEGFIPRDMGFVRKERISLDC